MFLTSICSMKYHKSQFLCDFRHEGVNIWKCSRVLSCILKKQPQATRKSKEKSLIWQNKVQRHWNIINLNFCVILGMKGLIFENTQGYSLDTRLYFEEGPLSYKKQQRKELHMPKQGSTALKYHKSQFLRDFGHEGVNIWKCSRVFTGYPPVFWRGTPKLQETAEKKT